MDTSPSCDVELLAKLLQELDFSGFHFKKIYQPQHLSLRDKNGWTLMHHAVHGDSVGSLKIMLDQGGSLANALDKEGWSPAMLAASHWNAHVLRLLAPWIDHALLAPGGRSLAMLCAGDSASLREVIDHCDPRQTDAMGRDLLAHVRAAYESGEPDKQCLAMVEDRLLRQDCASNPPSPRSRL